ncbi:hypothetical protein BGZ99_000208 [Dissophora globulifera]|uniref:Uncharacterized protein n=1 Tax=Dissophora globulifera TaxID=979702 RepID=A0A9P6RSI9_9FUNG|nr:hypothetical protein BGZ99_000208 [Dissophora globulifera]
MRTFDKIGIMDFTSHTTRLATSLQQMRFPPPALPLTGEQGESEDVAATAGLASLRSPESMKIAATDLIRSGLKFYFKQFEDSLASGELICSAGTTGEAKVTVKEPTLVAHFEPLKTPKAPTCKVEVLGSPRKHATTKDSQWVRDRKEIEVLMAEDSNEALLVDENTQDVYEGVSSNFFALDRKRGTLLTAPIGSVLQGTIQKVIINVCQAQNIPVEYTFPNLNHIQSWEGAFISSTSRLVLPIDKLVLADGSVKEFTESPTLELIRREVLKECQRHVENLLLAQDVKLDQTVLDSLG